MDASEGVGHFKWYGRNKAGRKAKSPYRSSALPVALKWGYLPPNPPKKTPPRFRKPRRGKVLITGYDAFFYVFGTLTSFGLVRFGKLSAGNSPGIPKNSRSSIFIASFIHPPAKRG